jgi:hypothetical protein
MSSLLAAIQISLQLHVMTDIIELGIFMLGQLAILNVPPLRYMHEHRVF